MCIKNGVHARKVRLTAAPSVDFFGRREEIAQFRRAFAQSTEGALRGLLIGGQPGIGKTRLAEEYARLARAAGAVVLWGTWREGTSLPEYWVWRQILRGILQELRLARLGVGLDSALSELSGLLPELRDQLPGLSPPLNDDSVDGRARLVDAAYRVVRAGCKARPVCLLLDNLHLAEAASLELLAGLFTELPACSVLVVGLFRDLPVYHREPFVSRLAELRQVSCVEECRLDNLEPRETAAMIEGIMEYRPPEGLLAEIIRSTRGHPLFVRETARLCKGRIDGSLSSVMNLLKTELPTVIAVAISRRLCLLSRLDEDMLRRASAIGEQFTREELIRLANGLSPDEVTRALETGVVNGFLRHEDGQYLFSHTVVHEAVRGLLTHAERSALCRALAAAEESPEDGRPRYATDTERALRVAGWWSESGGEEGKRKHRRWIRLAAEAALAARAWGQAVELFGSLEANGDGPAQSEEEAEASYGLGKALFKSGDKTAAVARLQRAFSWFRRENNLDRMIAIATEQGYLDAGEPGFANFHEQILDILPADSPQRGMAVCFGAVARFTGIGDYVGTERSLAEAMEIAERTGDPVLLTLCLGALAFIDLRLDRPQEALEKLERDRLILDEHPYPYAEYHLCSDTCQALVDLGRSAEALPWIMRGLALAERERDASGIAAACQIAGRIEAFSGNWDRARAYTERGLSAKNHVWVLSLRVYLEYAVGNFPEGDVYRRRIIAQQRRAPAGPWSIHIAAASTAVVRAMQSGDVRDLRSFVPDLRAAAAHPAAHPFVVVRAHLLLAWIGALTGDASLSLTHYKAVRALTPFNLVRPYHVQRILGLAAHAFGDHAAAVSHLEEALRLARHAGDLPLEGMILFDLGEARLPLDPTEGAPEEAYRCLSAARELASQLGMTPLQVRAERLLGTLRGVDGGVLPVHVHLTRREKALLALIAEGLTNKEIAARERISANTVANHVRSILARTGAGNRTEAVRIARSLGLL